MNHQAYIQHVLRVGGWCSCVRCDRYRACAAAAVQGGPVAADALLRRAVFDAVLQEAGAEPRA